MHTFLIQLLNKEPVYCLKLKKTKNKLVPMTANCVTYYITEAHHYILHIVASKFTKLSLYKDKCWS